MQPTDRKIPSPRALTRDISTHSHTALGQLQIIRH